MPEEEQIEQEESEMSDEEMAARLANLVGSTPSQEEKQNIHSFLKNVVTSKDTTKTGYLGTEELGMPTLPVRTYKELALFCSDIANMDYFADYFQKKAEIVTATSLSKDAKLLNLAVLTKKEVADVTKPRVVNKGWFKKKTTSPPGRIEES